MLQNCTRGVGSPFKCCSYVIGHSSYQPNHRAPPIGQKTTALCQWRQSMQIESLQQPSSRTLTSHRTQVLSMDIADLTAFVTHPTNGLQKFEHLLRTDRYCTVPEALAQTFLVLASPTMTISEKADQPPTVSPPLQVDMQYLFVFKYLSHKFDEMYCALKIQAHPFGWVKLYNESKIYHYVHCDKLKVDIEI